MNQEQKQICKWAEDAGGILLSDSENWGLGYEFELYQLEAFAALVAAAEREACAKVCDEQADELYESIEHHKCAEYLAEQIRARGEKS
jgi:hypothetical protein